MQRFNIESVTDTVVSSLYDYPISWGYSFSMLAFQPLISELMPVFNQVLFLFLIHFITIIVDWSRKKLNLPIDKKVDMDLVNDLKDLISRRKDFSKKNENESNVKEIDILDDIEKLLYQKKSK